ncbi:MAG TPA: EAL domain-containing response regulator [Dongiaceae bacterium]|nr:EAL domain-containing response regulator [Dongiaceae bacterium]
MGQLDVLVVDDSEVQRQFALNLCRVVGVPRLRDASNGALALEQLRQQTADVVMVDLEMPVMDGVELIRHIAKETLARAIIILSSKDPVLIASVGTMAEADGLSVLGTFNKPLNEDLLRCGLKQLESVVKHKDSAKQAEEVTATEISHALQANHLTLHYQPKLTGKGMLLKGVEALARWHDPVKGNISPGQFIAVAERHGLIDRLTRYLLELALRQKQQWQRRGVNFNLAFNLSPLSLADPTLVDWITQLTNLYGVAPNEITLEVTENALLGELASSIQTLARLRLKGFGVAIDDYGSGFANAQQLSRVPATELKIDRTLVHNVATRPQQRTILQNTVEMAHQLKLITVAEGVENRDDFDLLLQFNVELIQGYFLAKPMAADKLMQWMQTDLAQIRKDLRSH